MKYDIDLLKAVMPKGVTVMVRGAMFRGVIPRSVMLRGAMCRVGALVCAI